MYIAAKALADTVPKERLEAHCVYPHLKDIRTVSAHIAEKIAEHAYETGTAQTPQPEDLFAFVKSYQYQPRYKDLVRADE